MSAEEKGAPQSTSMADQAEMEAREDLLSSAVYRTYSYREDLFAEFDFLVSHGRQFDGLIIDLMQVGYSLPMQVLVKFNGYAQRLLKPQGVLLFIKADG